MATARTKRLEELRRKLQAIEQEQQKMEARGVELEKRLRGGAGDIGEGGKRCNCVKQK